MDIQAGVAPESPSHATQDEICSIAFLRVSLSLRRRIVLQCNMVFALLPPCRNTSGGGQPQHVHHKPVMMLQLYSWLGFSVEKELRRIITPEWKKIHQSKSGGLS